MRHLAPLLLVPLAACDDYLLQVEAGATGIDAILALEGDPTAGEGVFRNQCAVCHDPEGQEDAIGPALGPLVPTLDDATIVTIIVEGQSPMPPVPLEDQETADVLAWLRETFGGGS